ncbi:MAG: hypothetical protein HY270_03260 [Deltaproteobacteria bacterium]|nr:hypothetical protein [Deltaproteobacteria bacterium]
MPEFSRRAAIAWLAVVAAVLCVVIGGAAAQAPILKAAARQMRTVAKDNIGPVPLWDTSWWIEMKASGLGPDLARVDYRTRFVDGSEARSQAGGWDVGGSAVDGRLTVACPARADYDRRLRVDLRVRNRSGQASDWVTVDFPPSNEVQETGAVVVSSAPAVSTQQKVIGSVEVEADDRMSIGDVRAALQSKALAQGASAVVGLRLLRSSAERMVFAADLVRDVGVTPSPPKVGATQSLVGEISIPALRH